ncbi:hypothetical protein PIB30_023155 [Stylosanthes scabra]|uniref:Uncharacterized protein n=1 Tax=Stylosanthes scabra TaxID=79078 RepID=A0ABU6S9P1_9FABA|nr:hypothetical protein [Stylosanthes scabra]
MVMVETGRRLQWVLRFNAPFSESLRTFNWSFRKKTAQWKKHHPTPNSTHHTIHIHTNTPNPSLPTYPAAASSFSHSPSPSLQQVYTHTQIARTKTTNRLTRAEIPPPNTRSAQACTPREESPPSEQPPPPPPSSSTRTNKTKGKRPTSEDVPPPPLSPSTRSKRKRTMTNEAPPPPPPRYRGWTPLFDLKERVYPNLVKELYANMNYDNGLITSFVQRRNIYVDSERIGEISGLTVYTSRKWDPALNLSYHDALACIYTRIPLVMVLHPYTSLLVLFMLSYTA